MKKARRVIKDHKDLKDLKDQKVNLVIMEDSDQWQDILCEMMLQIDRLIILVEKQLKSTEVNDMI